MQEDACKAFERPVSGQALASGHMHRAGDSKGVDASDTSAHVLGGRVGCSHTRCLGVNTYTGPMQGRAASIEPPCVCATYIRQPNLVRHFAIKHLQQ